MGGITVMLILSISAERSVMDQLVEALLSIG